jgi:uncharacterized protein
MASFRKSYIIDRVTVKALGGVVREIWRYPVKSLAGEQLDDCNITGLGLEDDRRWALVDSLRNRAGKLLTIREHEQLMTYSAQLINGQVSVVDPNGQRRPLDALLVQEFADQAGRALELRDRPSGNFDDSPVLVVNLATVASFEHEVGMSVDHRRFRANFYVEGLEPDDELSWLGHHITVGHVRLEVTKRCDRCVVVTRDPDSTVASPILLRVLTENREACMGVYCSVTTPGRVRVGDSVGLSD